MALRKQRARTEYRGASCLGSPVPQDKIIRRESTGPRRYHSGWSIGSQTQTTWTCKPRIMASRRADRILGAASSSILDLPKVALISGGGTTAYNVGEVWHLLSEKSPILLVDLADPDKACGAQGMGAVFRATLDLTHPVTYGYDDCTRFSTVLVFRVDMGFYEPSDAGPAWRLTRHLASAATCPTNEKSRPGGRRQSKPMGLAMARWSCLWKIPISGASGREPAASS